jgi:hypothetical protein
MGIGGNAKVTIIGTNETDIQRVERLVTGEDNTSIGTIVTTKPPTNNDAMTSTKSVSTTVTIEELDQNMSKLSAEVAELKDLLIAMIKSKEPTVEGGTQEMEVTETDTNNKRKADESKEDDIRSDQ